MPSAVVQLALLGLSRTVSPHFYLCYPVPFGEANLNVSETPLIGSQRGVMAPSRISTSLMIKSFIKPDAP
jgi:hypothetical protein